MKNTFTALLFSLIAASPPGAPAAEMVWEGELAIASTYIFRGVRQFEGLALQGSAGASMGPFSMGIWYSSVNFASNALMETDPFVELVLTGRLALGANIYSYDFQGFNSDSDCEVELYGKVSTGPFGVAAHLVPRQPSTKNDPSRSSYWIELSAGAPLRLIDLGLTLEFGTYSSRFIREASDEIVGDVILSARREVIERWSVSWNASVPFNSRLDDNLWVTLTMSL